jgi:hypothetical protein
MKPLTYFLIVLLFFLHQDVWLWDSQALVFGVLPIGLAYHLAFSLLAGLLWAFACKTIWPTRWEEWAEQGEGGES